MCYVVTAVHKQDFMILINETPNKGRPGKDGHVVTGTQVSYRMCVFFPRQYLPVLRDSSHAVQVSCSLVRKILRIISFHVHKN